MLCLKSRSQGKLSSHTQEFRKIVLCPFVGFFCKEQVEAMFTWCRFSQQSLKIRIRELYVFQQEEKSENLKLLVIPIDWQVVWLYSSRPEN